MERTKRIDAEFFSKRHLRVEALLAKAEKVSIEALATVSDGNHFAISEDFTDVGVPYYRGQDVVAHVFIEQSSPRFITDRAYLQPHMIRSHLQSGDVLLSIIGSIGESSLVTSDAPATCSCKLAILRPKAIRPEYLTIFLRSEVGRSQSERFTRGAVQMGLLLEDMDQIVVARFSTEFEGAIAGLVQDARRWLGESSEQLREAEGALAGALGLGDSVPPEPLAYSRRASGAVAEGRWDAEFHRPKYFALEKAMAKRFELKYLSELGAVENGRTVPYDVAGTVPIIRSGDLSNLEDESQFLRARRDTPIRRLKKGDVLISSIGVGSIGKIQVFDKDGTYGTVSEVTIVRQSRVNPHFLASFLRSRFGQLQIDRYITGATGQLHLYKRDVGKIVIPMLPNSEQAQFERFAYEAATMRTRALALLARGRRAVEIGVEESEKTGRAYLERT